MILRPELRGTNTTVLVDVDTNEIVKKTALFTYQKRRAYKSNMLIDWNGKFNKEKRFAYIPNADAPSFVTPTSNEPTKLSPVKKVLSTVNFNNVPKPKHYIINDLKWKFLARTVLTGRNAMLRGDRGCGKTMGAEAIAIATNRPFFNINLGSTQDPKSTLIGNTHYDTDSGTYFKPSYFVQAIQTPNAVILLDELSRANPEAWNILMSVLDLKQRYLRLDDAVDCDTVKVADGVSFIATANVGTKYTSTNIMDDALIDRFGILELDLLDVSGEMKLMNMLFGNSDGLHDDYKKIAKFAALSRTQALLDSVIIDVGI